MELSNTIGVGIAVGAGYLAARAVYGVRNVLSEFIDTMDMALDVLGPDVAERQDGPEPCVCGSTDHESATASYVVVPASLENPPYGWMPLQAAFAFTDVDPFAIEMTLTVAIIQSGVLVGHDSSAWTFARDILDTAFGQPDTQSGFGDVIATYRSETNKLDVWLSDAKGVRQYVDVAEAGAVKELLVRSFELVPHGEETFDADGAIESLLDGTWEQ